jgi:hypothetical protein
MSMKNSTKNTGKGAREILVFSAVPQPTAPPRAPQLLVADLHIYLPDINLNILDRFSKNTQKSDIIKIHPVGAELIQGTDRQTDMMKLIVTFLNFV